MLSRIRYAITYFKYNYRSVILTEKYCTFYVNVTVWEHLTKWLDCGKVILKGGEI